MRPRLQEEFRYGEAGSATEDPFPLLKPPISHFLAEQTVLAKFLLALERKLTEGAITPSEMERLARRWVESLPRQRGAMVIPLSAALQPELALGQTTTRTRRTGTVRRDKRKTTMRSGKEKLG